MGVKCRMWGLAASCIVSTSLLVGCATSEQENIPAYHAIQNALAPRVFSKPIYPPEAKAAGIEGSLFVCFTVEPDGSVHKPYVKSASSREVKAYLGAAALKTVSKRTFYPWIVDGRPVSIGGICQSITYAYGAHASPDHKEKAPLSIKTEVIPIYPAAAVVRHVVGSVLVCFTVEADGSVREPYIRSASSAAARKYLGKAAVETMSKLQFFPWIDDGESVGISGVCHSISYALH